MTVIRCPGCGSEFSVEPRLYPAGSLDRLKVIQTAGLTKIKPNPDYQPPHTGHLCLVSGPLVA